MGIYAELRGFVITHRPCGVLRGQHEPGPADGYRLRIVCPCGARFERWLPPDDPEADLLRSTLQAFEN
jgi:hypothetical protein